MNAGELDKLAELHEKVRRLHSTPDERVELDVLMHGWLPALLAAARERDEMRAENERQAAEIARLREALTALLDAHARSALFSGDGHWDRARAALAQEPPA